jgi:hypothetical protein
MNENADKVAMIVTQRSADDCWFSVVSWPVSESRISMILEHGTRKAKSAVLCLFHFSSNT